MNLPDELINKIIMMNKPNYPYFNELSCRLNLKVKTQLIKHITGCYIYTYRYDRIFGLMDYDDLLEYRDDTLREYDELFKFWE